MTVYHQIFLDYSYIEMFLFFIQIMNKFNYTRINMKKFTVLILMEENIMILYKMMHTPEDILGNKYASKVFTIFLK